MRGLSSSFQSSGDLIADRRFEWARDCEAKGDLAAAADLMEQALEIAPGYASAWFALAGLREKRGDPAGAVAAYRQARASDPEDRQGASLHLMRLGAEQTAGMPEAYLRELFDQYAPAFDTALQGGLDYRAPALLRAAVGKVCAARGRPMRFGSTLDLGCGTGLAGVAFRPFADWLTGVDLSSGMVAEAKRKVIYDRLSAAEMAHFLTADAAGGALHHLIVAADVFVYAVDLAPVVSACMRALDRQGLLAFTVETHGGGGVILGDKLRYAHGADHVRAALTAAGLEPLHLEQASTRTENGVPVPGLIVVAGSASTLPRSPS